MKALLHITNTKYSKTPNAMYTEKDHTAVKQLCKSGRDDKQR